MQAGPVLLPDVRPALELQIARLQSSNFQSLYRAIVKQMLLDDLIDVLAIDIAVPDPFRIDHHYRALIAAIQASSAVDANLSGPIFFQRFDALFGVRLNIGRAALGATG